MAHSARIIRFVSDHRAQFTEIAHGVNKQDLAVDTLDYRRAKDKSDKSMEVYKFFVNALYVALTRVIQNLYIIESDTAHPLYRIRANPAAEWQRLFVPTIVTTQCGWRLVHR